jgi:GTPase
LLIHVVDASDPEVADRIDAVHQVLNEIGGGTRPEHELLVWNKQDLADPDDLADLLRRHPGSFAVSAQNGHGVDALIAAIAVRIRAQTNIVELVVPYDRGDVLAALYREGEVLVEVHTDTATRLQVRLPSAAQSRFAAYAS